MKYSECVPTTESIRINNGNVTLHLPVGTEYQLVEVSNDIKVQQVGSKIATKLDTYYANKRRVTRFYANCIDTRKLYTKVVKDLLATGKYRKIRQVWVNGGILWDLERIN